MHAVQIAFIVGSHLLSLALAIYTTRTSGVPVEILLFAFLIDYVLRLTTIQILHADLSRSRHGVVHAIAPYITRLPAPGQEPHPVRDGDGGPPAALGKYLLVMAALAFFAFVLMQVNADQQIRFAGASDFVWALLIAIIYWLNSLLTRTMVIDARDPVTRTFGYNSKEVTILAFAVLTGAVIVVVRQNMGLDASGWTVMGPLLFFRFLYDLGASLGGIRQEASPPAPNAG